MVKLSGLSWNKRIKELRLSKGLTQTDLARIIGVDQRNISKWEHAEHFPHDHMQARIACALNVQQTTVWTIKQRKRGKRNGTN